MNEKDLLVVLSTCPDLGTATGIAETLVQQGLTACVNVVPGLRSIYVWNGELQRDDEILLIMKTSAGRFDSLRETLVALHPYEMPEVVALPIAAGHHPYLQWLAGAAQASPVATP